MKLLYETFVAGAAVSLCRRVARETKSWSSFSLLTATGKRALQPISHPHLYSALRIFLSLSLALA